MESSCTFREIGVQKSSHPYSPTGICLLSLEPTDSPRVHSGNMGIPPRSLSPKCLTANWAKDGRKVLGFSPIPYPTSTPSSPGNICGSSGHFLLASHTVSV